MNEKAIPRSIGRILRLLTHSADFYANSSQLSVPEKSTLWADKEKASAWVCWINFGHFIFIANSCQIFFWKVRGSWRFQQQAACLKFLRLIIFQQQLSDFRMLIFHLFSSLFLLNDGLWTEKETFLKLNYLCEIYDRENKFPRQFFARGVVDCSRMPSPRFTMTMMSLAIRVGEGKDVKVFYFSRMT